MSSAGLNMIFIHRMPRASLPLIQPLFSALCNDYWCSCSHPFSAACIPREASYLEVTEKGKIIFWGSSKAVQQCWIYVVKWDLVVSLFPLFNIYAKLYRAYCWYTIPKNIILMCCHKFWLGIYYVFRRGPFFSLIKKNQFISYLL